MDRQEIMTRIDQQKKMIEKRMLKVKHKIAVLSGKGGVGKSTISAALAVYLSKKGKKAGILDADATGPNIPLMFGLKEKVKAGDRGIIPPEKGGIKIISTQLFLESGNEAVVWRGPLISSAIKQFLSDVAWGELDYLIIDLPPGTADETLTILQSLDLDGAIIVSTPQKVSYSDVIKAINLCKDFTKILGLVENMSYVECPHCGKKIMLFGKSRGKEIAEKMNVPYAGQLPLNPSINQITDKGEVMNIDLSNFKSVFEKVIK